MGQHIRAGALDIWIEQVGEGPDVPLIGGRGDTVESWQFQLDGLRHRYRLTAFDNRGAGARRCPTKSSRRRCWPMTRLSCCVRWGSQQLTSSASRWEAPSPKR
jgi:pimeloyl-ACP methyl ester carboxylesterase